MTTFDEIWPKLRRGKAYRDAFVAEQAKQAIGFQIQALMEQFGLTQTELAKRAGLSQGVVSRAADPTYGNLTVNTCVRIAAGFDVAFVGRFVPFSEFPKWFDRLYSEQFTVPSFVEEDADMEQPKEAADADREITDTPTYPVESNNVYAFLLTGQRKPPKKAQMRPAVLSNGLQFGEITDVRSA